MKGKESKEAKDAYYKEAKSRVQQVKHDLVSKASFYDKEKISERLHRMILYAVGRQDWYDDRQHRLLNIGLALIAGSGALAVFGANIVTYLPPLSMRFGLVLLLSVLGTGIGLVYSYRRQIARDHPYRKLVDIRSWYFIYTFPSPLKDSLSKKFSRAKQQIEETIEAYRACLNRWLEWSPDQDRFIEEDLEQVFILQLLQRYRYQGVKTMSRTLFYGTCVSATFLVLAILAYAFGWGL